MQLSKVQKIEDLQYIKDLKEFDSNLQKGDLGLSQFIEYGYGLYGQTRSGKTSTGHLLSGNVLRGNKIQGQDMVQSVTSKYYKAIIGNTMNSETLIPNFFKLKQQKTLQNQTEQSMNLSSQEKYIIDTPGYGDTYGVLRILANGFFHYRMYSRVKNMKFILCFDSNQLKNTASKFINTIVQFSSYFKNFMQKGDLWQSCAFLFTKVDQNQTKLQDLYQKVEAVITSLKTQLKREVQASIKQFIRFILKERRIFYIKKFKKGQSCTVGNLLKQIDSAIPKWWRRSMDPKKNQVDMSSILFSVAKQITLSTTQSQVSQKQFEQLTSYYNLRINELLKQQINDKHYQNQGGLSFVLNQLVKDSMGSPQDRNFLNVMENYIKKYYDQFDPAYKEERQKAQKNMFSENQKNSQTGQKSQKRSFTKDKNYLVKKFLALKQIQRLKQQISTIEYQQKDLSWLQRCEELMYEMVKEFCKISYKRSNTTQIIYKYGYLIHRIIEDSKMFLLLTKLSTNAQGQKRLQQAAGGQKVLLMRLMRDFMNRGYFFENSEAHYDDFHLKFTKRFKLSDPKYKKLEINEKLLDFFCDIQEPDEEDNQKIVELILSFSQKYLSQEGQRPSITNKSTQNLIIRLLNARSNCQQAFYMKPDHQNQTRQLLFIRKSTQYLGRLLESLKKYDLARKVYKTVRYVDSVSKLYRQEIQSLRSINRSKSKNIESLNRQFDLLLEYGTYLSSCARNEEGIKILQEAYERCENISQLTNVKNALNDLLLKRGNQKESNEYAESLFNGEFFENMKEQLQQQILKIFGLNGGDM